MKSHKPPVGPRCALARDVAGLSDFRQRPPRYGGDPPSWSDGARPCWRRRLRVWPGVLVPNDIETWLPFNPPSLPRAQLPNQELIVTPGPRLVRSGRCGTVALTKSSLPTWACRSAMRQRVDGRRRQRTQRGAASRAGTQPREEMRPSRVGGRSPRNNAFRASSALGRRGGRLPSCCADSRSHYQSRSRATEIQPRDVGCEQRRGVVGEWQVLGSQPDRATTRLLVQ